MEDQKPTNRERVKEIVDGIEQNIQELFQSEKYFDYLRTMSRFHNYSVNNTLLIHMQRPNAAQPVAGFRKWKQFGRYVKKGEKGLTIIAPTPLKKKIEEMKLDPDTKAPVLDQDGNAIIEEKIVEIPLFKPVKVFSADQTDGEPLPSLATDLTGNVEQYEAFMEALRRTSPVPVTLKPLEPSMDGFFSNTTQSITIREGMSEVQTVCATVHEIAHAVLHNKEQDRLAAAAGTDKEPPKAKDNNTKEVEAESVSFAVCQYYGIDTSENSLGYIATWSKDRSLPELKASLETITKTVNSLIASIDKHFAEVCKERGIDLAAQQPETSEPDTPEKYVADFFSHLEELSRTGLIPRPYPPDKKESFEKVFLAYLHKGNFDSFRYVLDDAAEKAHMPSTAVLRGRLEALSDQWDAALVYKIEPFYQFESGVDRHTVQAYENRDGQLIPGEAVFSGTLAQCRAIVEGLEQGTLTLRQMRQPDFEPPVAPEPKYIYKMDADPHMVNADDQHYIQVYERTDTQTLIPGPMLFVGQADMCAGLLERLNNGSLQQDDFFTVNAARMSCYTTKDGVELDAFVGPDDKVYMGRRDHYDNRGHYLNDDKSLIHISDNERVFDVISGSSVPYTRDELLATGYFSQEEYDRFIALQLNEPQPEKEAEALFLVDGAAYLHVQATDEGWDYTLYAKDSQKEMDGGLLDIPDIPLSDAAARICQMQEIGTKSIQPVSMELLETLQDAQSLPPTPEKQNISPWLDTKLDKYPLPDVSLLEDDLEIRGYTGRDLLPLTRGRAADLLDQDMTIYIVRANEDPEMIFDQDDLMEQPEGMMYAVPREEWEISADFLQTVADRMNCQGDREKAFLDHSGDCFAIYQMKDDPTLQDIHFESLDWLKSKGRTVARENYNLIYTAPLSTPDGVNAALDQLWYQFNNEHPADFLSPSVSVSDIIAIKRDGVVSFHYCDSFGFQQLPDFIKPENYLKNAEMSAEDDYGMIDGIINNGSKEGPSVAELEAQVKAGQSISLADLADAIHREKGEKKSVLAKLNAAQPQQERKRSAQKKSAERER